MPIAAYSLLSSYVPWIIQFFFEKKFNSSLKVLFFKYVRFMTANLSNNLYITE